MKKVKNEIKRAFRLPGNAAVMTMMAVILVCAAPALISIIDDSMVSSSTIEVDGLQPSSYYKEYVGGIVAPGNAINSVHEGGTYTLVPITSDLSSVTYYTMDGFDSKAFLDAGVNKVRVTLDADNASSIRFIFGGDTWKALENVLDAEGNRTNVWEYTLTSVDKARVSSAETVSIRVLFTVGTAPPSLSVTPVTYSDYGIAYGEIIIGATGALLLICAILATPWVSTSGLTVKRRR